MMHPVLLMSFGVSMVLSVSDKLPEIDIAASCKEVAGFGLALPYNPEHCVADEKEARNRLQQSWSSFPAVERSRCVAETMVGTASYVDILTCLEMTEEAKRETRQEEREVKQEADTLSRPMIGASKAKRGIK